ncbi:hypothetical protein AB1Y20_017016 [Prymnesium parvum]|uniref:Uncharacterized protein n=1 Tax=Prymnesium parvum TaxID=97485 RepID=A0AB34I7N9_PRYPA
MQAFSQLLGGAPPPPPAPTTRPVEDELARVLSRSFDDGSRGGRAAAAQFVRLAALACGVIGRRHREAALQLTRLYRAHDPSLRPPLPPRPAAARRLCLSLHHSLTRTGFSLCSREEEVAAAEGHFGDESVWNVPVAMEWEQLDGALVDEEAGGFDAYAADEAAGRGVARPSWAHKLLLYSQGETTVQKRGYFVVAKLEEMAVRALARAGVMSWSLVHAALGYSMAPLLGVCKRVGSSLEAALRTANPLWADRLRQQTERLTSPTAASPPPLGRRATDTSIACMPLGWWSLFEQTTLRAPAYSHVLVVHRHADAATHAHGNAHHVSLGLFRNVPKVDVELLLPHQQVCMPAFQRSQFGAMAVLGVVLASPLLHQEALSLTGLLTLYTFGAYAARTALRWRSTKQLYQQLLLSYQSANRIGSSDGALLYLAHLAEAAEKQTVLLSLRTLLQQQIDRAPPLSAADLVARNEAVLLSWGELSHLPLERHCDARATADHLARLGVAEERGARLALKPLDEAVAIAQALWDRPPLDDREAIERELAGG